MLLYVTLGLTLVTLGVARSRGKRIARVGEEVRKLGYLEGSLRELRKETDLKLDVTRRHLAQVASGRRLRDDQILEGKPFADVSAADGLRMFEDEPGLFILDVRTPGEFASRHIPGARLIPVDQVQGRVSELPRPGTPMLVVCAGGSRSAAACAMLAEQGYGTLYNLASGMGGWRGPTESGTASA